MSCACADGAPALRGGRKRRASSVTTRSIRREAVSETKGEDETKTVTTTTTTTTSWTSTYDYEDVLKSERHAYLADPHMRRGYYLHRRPKDVLISLFAWHNESVNVWSHILGLILFLVLFISWCTYNANLAPAAGFPTRSPHLVQISRALSDAMGTPPHVAVAVTDFLHKASDPISNTLNNFETWVMHEAQGVSKALGEMSTEAGEMLHKVKAEAAQAIEDLHTEAGKAQASFRISKNTMREWFDSLSNDAVAVSAAAKLERAAEALDASGRRAVQALRAWLLHEPSENRTPEGFYRLIVSTSPTTNESRFSSSLAKGAPLVPVWPLLVFCFGSVMCLGCSAAYHAGAAHSKHTHDLLCRFDLGGISFMILGSFVPLVYYTFFEEEWWRNFYLIVGSLLCSSTLFFTALPADLMHQVKKARVASYLLTGCFASLPLFHAASVWGWSSDHVARYLNDGLVFFVGGMYVVGAFFYVSRIPERYFPGTFDLLLASHQIWHLLVLAAAVVHYMGVVSIFEWRVRTESAKFALAQEELLMAAAM